MSLRSGMLWLDNSRTRGLSEKIALAVAYYVQKYGMAPDAVEVNPRNNPAQIEIVDGVAVINNRHILPSHILVGQYAKQEAR